MLTEDRLKRKCVAWIKKNMLSSKFWFYCPTDRFYSGIPDIIFCANGKFGVVELKALKGKVSAIQEYTLIKINQCGGRSAVCRTIEEFKGFVTSFFLKQKGE